MHPESKQTGFCWSSCRLLLKPGCEAAQQKAPQAERELLAFLTSWIARRCPQRSCSREEAMLPSLLRPQKLDVRENPLCFWQFCSQEQGRRHFGSLPIRAHTLQAMEGKMWPSLHSNLSRLPKPWTPLDDGQSAYCSTPCIISASRAISTSFQ